MIKSTFKLVVLTLAIASASIHAEIQSSDLTGMFSKPKMLELIKNAHPPKACVKKTDAEYQKLIIGKWSMDSGEVADKLKQDDLELRYTYKSDSTIIMNIGFIKNKSFNLYEAKGTYFIANGIIYSQYTWENRDIGMTNKSLYDEIDCMDKDTMQLDGQFGLHKF